jgi:predicted acetyltransferase
MNGKVDSILQREKTLMKKIENIQFEIASNEHELNSLKKEWRTSLTSPPDGMWESFREKTEDWAIKCFDQEIGYASIDNEGQLLQFYVHFGFLPVAKEIFKKFIAEKEISKAVVGTNNPVLMTASFPSVKMVKVDTYLFREFNEVDMVKKAGTLREGSSSDDKLLIDFYHKSIGADREWLTSYLGERLERKELFFFSLDTEIIGACEVRTSASNSGIADIGMVVSPEYRMRGYGSYLLYKAKKMALLRNQKPICSCEAENIGSYKSIINAGFVSQYQLLKVTF